MGALVQDLRCAARLLAKQPAFTLLIVLSIGLGIGANATAFAWMESLVLNPYPAIKEYSRLVAINTANQDGTGVGSLPFSYPVYRDWRDAAQWFDGLSAEALFRANLRRIGEDLGEPVWGEFVSGNYFDTLQVRPAMGRALSLDDERNAAQVAVISHGLWQRRFGGQPSIIGQQVHLNGVDVTIIGVTSPGFNGALVGYGFDLWIPLTVQPRVSQGRNSLEERDNRWLQGTARLKLGIRLEQAQEGMKLVARHAGETHGEMPVRGVAVRLMRERFTGSLIYPLSAALLGITGLVLLVACANVANLLLTRGVTRQREIGIRLALGGSRGRIIRQLLTETCLLSIGGGILGLFLAVWGKDVLYLFIPPTGLPVALSVTINGRIIAYAMFVTLITGFIFGLLPALRASQPELVQALNHAGRGVTASRSWLRNALIVAQVAFSLVALVSAGLFLRSLQQAGRMELGFNDPEHILLIGTDLNLAGVAPEAGTNVYPRLLERVRALPGVTSASVSTMVPLGFGGHVYGSTQIEGYVAAPDEQVSTERVIVGDGYFETMGIPILRGRGITTQDQAKSERVAVINETLANRYWPGQDAIGKHLNQGFGWAVVVGLSKDGKYRDLNEKATPVVYSAMSQQYAPTFTLHVRTTSEPKLLIETVRHAYAAVDTTLPFFDPHTLAEHIQGATLVQMIGAWMLSGFSILALLLAAIGLYGVLAHAVKQDRRGLAIRIAVGATPAQVLSMVFKQGLLLTSIGLLVGLGLAAEVSRFLSSQLLEVRAVDPWAYVIAAGLCVFVAMMASLVPATRATKVDPLADLRTE